MLEEAFDKVKEASGQQDIDTIVHDFIKKEDLIFALYNYVSLQLYGEFRQDKTYMLFLFCFCNLLK